MQNRGSVVLSIAVLLAGVAVSTPAASLRDAAAGGTRRRRAQGGAGPSAGRADAAHCGRQT